MSKWRPLSARQAGDEQWHDRVPAALADELREWIHRAGRELLAKDLDRVLVRLHLKFREPTPADDSDDMTVTTRQDHLREFLAYHTPDKRLLDVVDAFLDLLRPRPPLPKRSDPLVTRFVAGAELAKPDYRKLLQQHLDDARVVYRIADDGRSLVRRTDPSTALALQDAASAADDAPLTGSASDFLQSAWTALQGLHPDPPRAYSNAIKAVEAAAHSVVQPRHAKATLGTMLGELRSNTHLFTVQIGSEGTDDGATLVAMVALLWDGQTSRHGGQRPTRMETEGEARAALHLATTLVAWFAFGAVIRRT